MTTPIEDLMTTRDIHECEVSGENHYLEYGSTRIPETIFELTGRTTTSIKLVINHETDDPEIKLLWNQIQKILASEDTRDYSTLSRSNSQQD